MLYSLLPAEFETPSSCGPVYEPDEYSTSAASAASATFTSAFVPPPSFSLRSDDVLSAGGSTIQGSQRSDSGNGHSASGKQYNYAHIFLRLKSTYVPQLTRLIKSNNNSS